MNKPPDRPDRFLTLAEVCARVRLSPTTLWRRERDDEFPKRVRVSKGRVAWRESEIDAFIAGLWRPRGREP